MKHKIPYSARLPMTVGFTALILLVGGLGTWSVVTKVSGAVIANGLIVVESNRQVVQHAEGGVIAEIRARDGDYVDAGSTLILLDDTLLRTELSIIQAQVIELGARKARLVAERDGQSEIEIAQDILLRSHGSAEARSQIDGQRTLFYARKESLAKEYSQIEERIEQSKNQIKGAVAQRYALRVQETLMTAELSDLETLLSKGLVQVQRVTALRRDAAGIAGDIGKLDANIAQLRGQIAALEIERLKVTAGHREQAIVTLRDIQFRALELKEEERKLLERLSRLNIKAPTAGTVYNSTVFAENAVVRPAEPLMYIIPQDQPLAISTRVEAIHIDQIHVGQPAALRFTAFDQRLTPEIEGSVTLVSADVFQDELTGLNYYRVDLVPHIAELAKLKDEQLLPGMPVEAYLKTAERTPLSYVTKPMTDYFRRALRE